MDVCAIPFNRFLGISASPTSETGDLFLEGSPEKVNHLGTVHAAAQYALAEACSGHYLLQQFGDLAGSHVPVVRRAEVKYKKPATGKIFAGADATAERLERFLSDVKTKGRAIIAVDVRVTDENGIVTMTATYEWFVSKILES